MGKLVTVLFIFLAVNPYVTLGQENATAVATKQRRAEELADTFVERFRETLDFGIAWKAFRMSDAFCTHRANGILRQTDYDRLKLDSETIEKMYVAVMNYYYLKTVYDLSLNWIESQSDSSESEMPREIATLEKRFFQQNNDRQPQNVEEVGELIRTFDQLTALYRKHMPKNAMRSPAWRANQKYLLARSGVDHTGILHGAPTFCVARESNVYMIDRGVFYFYIVEEGGKMKVAGLGID